MTIDDSRAALHRAVEDLWLAVAELVLTTNEDQPEQGDLAAAEHVAEVAVELQGRVAAALAQLPAIPPREPAAALRALAEVDWLLREAAVLYWRGLCAHGPVAQLRGSTRRRGGAWPSWWSGVEQSLDRCEQPLDAAQRAAGAVWREVAAAPLAGTSRIDILRRSS